MVDRTKLIIFRAIFTVSTIGFFGLLWAEFGFYKCSLITSLILSINTTTMLTLAINYLETSEDG